MNRNLSLIQILKRLLSSRTREQRKRDVTLLRGKVDIKDVEELRALEKK